MAYTKNYYHILNLPAPSWGSSTRTHPPLTVAALRRAYKTALLAAHPDKSSTPPGREAQHAAYTVDDVKEAYAVLAKPGSRAEYDEWVVRNWGVAGGEGGHNSAVRGDIQSASFSHDFVLGLEVLDLGDFSSSEQDGGDGTGSGGENAVTQWTRPCRCGAATGFRILEEELEGAEKRGEKEVLVGCEGCSLWVRVGFDVEEG